MLTPKLTTPMTPLQKAFSLVLNGLFTAFYLLRFIYGVGELDAGDT
jgi:hypothetical protein